ncbi:hypothetical protein TVAG_016550 [Trichomonas vaginalis G3]|uniref:Uncharacterized protein n=1 Tax=Trichomonas vaginalis (strain ATCC PRA-98 / G3) TaxID=412133 RepID=A2EQZ3_TRIV3|nr:hypothetical protein TVAGG3_0535450 [Trichomonas vaginalis G3]EAY04883.1 hypothetical protein TVAG_016550 [Trichomonas vaginalis G3]KAI5519459.1 hypothetical protein TVAGG3_0535450 [Trichomonas vaginalis G3]|eukprot:XP_001317106.1 hypothetical protein [Trichomonas vaginalis G3]
MAELIAKFRNNAERIKSRGDKVSYMTTFQKLLDDASKYKIDLYHSEIDNIIDPIIKDVTCRVLVKALSIAANAFGFIDHMSRDIQRNKDLLSLSLKVHYKDYYEIMTNMRTSKKKIASENLLTRDQMIEECKQNFKLFESLIENDQFEPFVFLSQLNGSETRIIYTRKNSCRLVIVFYQKGTNIVPLCYYVVEGGAGALVDCEKPEVVPRNSVKHVFPQINDINLNDWFSLKCNLDNFIIG